MPRNWILLGIQPALPACLPLVDTRRIFIGLIEWPEQAEAGALFQYFNNLRALAPKMPESFLFLQPLAAQFNLSFLPALVAVLSHLQTAQ